MAHLIPFFACNWQFLWCVLFVLLRKRRQKREFAAELWPRAFPARANGSYWPLAHASILLHPHPTFKRGQNHFSLPVSVFHSAALQPSKIDYVSTLLHYSLLAKGQTCTYSSIKRYKKCCSFCSFRSSMRIHAQEIKEVTEFHLAGCKTSDVHEWANRPNDGVETMLLADVWNSFVCRRERTESSPPLDAWCHILFRKYPQFVVTVGEKMDRHHISHQGIYTIFNITSTLRSGSDAECHKHPNTSYCD